MKEDKSCFYLSIETTPMGDTYLQCINDESEYYLGFVDNGECEKCKKFYSR